MRHQEEQRITWCCGASVAPASSQQPAGVLPAAAQRMLACARCMRFDPDSGMVDVCSAGDDGRATCLEGSQQPLMLLTSSAGTACLDGCMWQALQCMIDQ
jgi:hypothetical protein